MGCSNWRRCLSSALPAVQSDPTNHPALLVEPSDFRGVSLLKPKHYADMRGAFCEAWHRERYEKLGLVADFVQDNVVESSVGVLRGMHFQHPRSQLKLVSAAFGEIFDVVVDIRKGSPTFGKYQHWILSSTNRHQLWIEPGFAHGYQVLSEKAVVCYKCTHIYEPDDDRTLNWADPTIGIKWPLANPMTSAKDKNARNLSVFLDEDLFKF